MQQESPRLSLKSTTLCYCDRLFDGTHATRSSVGNAIADAVVLCGETCEEVQNRLEGWRSAMEDRGMRVNPVSSVDKLEQVLLYLYMEGKEAILLGEINCDLTAEQAG